MISRLVSHKAARMSKAEVIEKQQPWGLHVLRLAA